MTTVKNYLSLIKFSHTIFALPFALIGFCLAVYNPMATWLSGVSINFNEQFQKSKTGDTAVKLVLVLFCMVTARSAAMAFNRYLDRAFDAKNPRTAIREIPAGIISANNALIFTIINCLLFVVCTYFINRICFILSPVALFIILFYSYTKRFTALCHLILGLGLSLAPIGAYLAVTGQFQWLPLFFSFAVLSWVSGFDVIYALQDVAFDQQQHLHSIPAWLGNVKALRISEILHAASALFVILAGIYGHFGWLYWLGTVFFSGMLIYQHGIVKPNDLKRVNIAFMTANGIASVVFSIFVILDMLILHH